MSKARELADSADNNLDSIVADSSGNVGIGTDSPTYKLESSGSSNTLKLVNGSTYDLRFVDQNSLTNVYSYGSQDLSINTRYANNILFKTSDSERMRIDSSGNLLVSKTSTDIGTVGVEVQADGSLYATKSLASGGQVALFNRQTSDGEIIDFRKDGTTVGSIGTASSYLTIGSGDTGLLFDDISAKSIRPWNLSTNSSSDADTDLGLSSQRFKDLYLSGGVYLGGTGSANYLDDYEEGTWTPSINNGTLTWTVNKASYVRIGKIVHLEFYASLNADGDATQMRINGLPFTAANNSYSSHMANNGGYTNYLFCRVQNNDTNLRFYTNPQVSVSQASLDNDHLIFAVTYEAA